MFVPETPRSADYRFWFDVREPGAAAYAAKLGWNAVNYFGLFSVVNYTMEGHWLAGLIWLAATQRLSAGIRQLSPIAAAIGVFLLPAYYTVTRLYFFVPWFDPMTLAVLTGLPPAIWAAWIHRGLALEERLRLVEIPEPSKGWRSRIGEWAGWSRQRGAA